MRQTYIIFFAFAILAFLIKTFSFKKNILKFLSKIILVVLGLTIVSLPQAMINEKHFKVNTPIIQTDKYVGYDLFVYNAKGLTSLLKADFYLVDPLYPEQVGASCHLNKIEKDTKKFIGFDKIKTMDEYLKYVKKNPEFFAKSYAASFFLGMTSTYSSTFTKNEKALTELFYTRLILNYFLWALTAVILLRKIFGKNNKLGEPAKKHNILVKFFISIIKIPVNFAHFCKENYISLIVFGGIILSALAATPTKMETRYYLPMYILMYGGLTAFIYKKISFKGFNSKRFWQLVRKYAIPTLILTLVFVYIYSGFFDDNETLVTVFKKYDKFRF